ncbi:hypothetical protein L484_001062 [Morus notabilis]|uniref:Uncharacterized protein n=1 Tax=Morus notabilis TaxID=981085 RepID=W9R5X8_9ROSA|nr:hypothetical protein L484_001062 [Morus notabilis]
MGFMMIGVVYNVTAPFRWWTTWDGGSVSFRQRLAELSLRRLVLVFQLHYASLEAGYPMRATPSPEAFNDVVRRYKEEEEEARAAMASRAVFLTLRRCREISSLADNSRPIPFFGKGETSRMFCSGTLRSYFVEEDSVESDDVKSRIFRLRLPKRSATNVLQRWISEGNQISISELRQISKDLRKSHRYKHALERRQNYTVFSC